MTLHEQVSELRAASRRTGQPHLSTDTADALNHLAGTINRSLDALWDAVETVARAVDQSGSQGVDSGS